jgi:hypothetical protein
MFRRVSDKNEGDNSWIHKGFQPHKFMEKALEETNVDEIFIQCRDKFIADL